MMTRQDPHSNLLRVALATMGARARRGRSRHGAALQLRHSACRWLRRRMARNTQTILLEESRLAAVADPTRGSGHVEALTAALVEKALAILDDIEASGGMLAALKSGKVQAMVAEAGHRQREALLGARRRSSASRTFRINRARAPPILDMPVTGDSAAALIPVTCTASLWWSAEGVETPTVPMVRKHEEAGAPIPARFKPSAPPHVTPEGIALKPAYGAEDIAGLDQVDSWPGLAPICAAPTPPCTSPSCGPSGNMPLSTRKSPMPSITGAPGPDGSVGGVRSADASRL